jgi:hypothetical protein
MSGIFKEKQVYPFWVVISIAIILGMSPFILVDIMEESLNFNKAMFISSAVALFAAFFFLLIRLKIRMDQYEIRIIFIPFIWRERIIKWSEVKKVEVRKSKSIREFGGWGYRIGKGKRAYTIYGHWGVDITLINDMHRFIGTQKNCELDAFLKNVVYPKYPNLRPEHDLKSDCK